VLAISCSAVLVVDEQTLGDHDNLRLAFFKSFRVSADCQAKLRFEIGFFGFLFAIMSDDEEAIATVKNHSLSKKGPYALVGLNEVEDDNNNFTQDLVIVESISKWIEVLHYNLIPEHWYGFRSVELLDSVEGLRLFKFTLVTVFAMVFMFYLARFMNWEHDSNYSLHDMLIFDAGNMMLDIIVFFLIGRLYKQRGVDHLAWTVMTLVASIYTSWSYTFNFLQHSVSLYDMHCSWPLTLWLYLLVVLSISALLIFKHIQYARQQERIVLKLLEIILAAVIWIMPQLSHPNFHFHHWFAGWMVGMHFNFDTWWSRAAMAWCWGQYINGISTWGRDPQLTCAYAYYLSIDQHCPYMKCFQEQITVHEANSNRTENQTVYMAFPEPDWRNCTADGNYNP
jgi:hypothetical protein